MKGNMGVVDRVIRFVVGVILLILGIAVIKSVVWTVIAIAVGAVMLLTSITSICLLYMPFGLKTKRGKEEQA